VHSSKTKLVWSVSSYFLESSASQNQLTHFAGELKSFGIDALRCQYTQSSSTSLAQLKNVLDHMADKPSTLGSVNSYCDIPFILSPLGRKATLRLKNFVLDVSAKQELSGIIAVDFQACAQTHPKAGIEASLIPQALVDQVDFQIVLSCKDMLKSLNVGAELIISYGQVNAEIISLEKTGEKLAAIRIRLKDSGQLLSAMDVHSALMSRELFPLLPEDKQSIESHFNGLADYILVNGCKTIADVKQLKTVCLGQDSNSTKRHPTIAVGSDLKNRKAQLPPKFLYKIDSALALLQLEELLPIVDGIVLSRSEMSLTVPANTLPIVQKQVLATCNQAAKLVIVASEIMYSMRQNPNPTRAEVSDLANTALDGADAILLSEEVTEGPYRLLVHEVCNDTLLNSEIQSTLNWKRVPFKIQNEDDAIAFGALHIAEQAHAKAIVCLTEGGYTAQRLASLRAPIPVISITYNECIARQLNVLRSVESHVLETTVALDDLLAVTKSKLVNSGSLQKGDKFVFVSLSASAVSQKNSNIFTLQEIE
jgi:pyruvate kinase